MRDRHSGNEKCKTGIQKKPVSQNEIQTDRQIEEESMSVTNKKFIVLKMNILQSAMINHFVTLIFSGLH